MRGKNSAERLLIELLSLEPVEFIGICKIIGVDIYKNSEENEECSEATKPMEPREFCDIWCDVCDTIDGMNRVRRKNLGKLIYAAVEKEK